jgi:hypothetical protein
MKRYLIIDKEMGVFLGTYLKFALFAANDGFDVVKAYAFEDEESAHDFVRRKTSLTEDEYFLAPIETKDKYVSVVDMIKAGYGEHTHNLINNLQMISQEEH